MPELANFPDIDTEAIYQVVVNCFPERVPWGVEAKLVGSARYVDQNNNQTTLSSTGSIGLYNSATLRSQQRVKIGVAETAEQIGYVEKVAHGLSQNSQIPS